MIVHAPVSCRGCGGDLGGAGVAGTETRQVFDLPKAGPFVTEHRMETKRCPCGCVTKAEAPSEATAPACYGPGVRAPACYLAVYQHLPYDRMRRLFADVFGTTVSEGTLVGMVKEAGGALGQFSQVVGDLLAAAPAVHFDETGARTEGSLHWVHVASTALFTLLVCDKRRGKVGMQALGVIERMNGVAVHDGWAFYKSYEVLHALCNAHHVRELQRVVDNLTQDWVDKLIHLLIDRSSPETIMEEAGASRPGCPWPPLCRRYTTEGSTRSPLR